MRLAPALALIAALALPPVPTGAEEASQARISGIFQSLGYDRVFRAFGPAIAIGVTATETRTDVARQLREAVDRSFDPDSILARIVARTDSALSADVTGTVAEFHDSALGRKVAALERRALDDTLGPLETTGAPCCPGDPDADLAALPAAEAADPARFALYRRMGTAIDAGPRLDALGNAIIVAVLTGMVAGDPAMAGMLDMMIESAVAETRAISRDRYGELILLQAHRSFGTLEIAELERLVTRLETPAFRSFHTAMNAAVASVIGEDSRALGERIGRILRANPD